MPTTKKAGASKPWRTERCCENCPFADTEKGAHMRMTLGDERVQEIQDHLLDDGHFHCHATIDYGAYDDIDEEEGETFESAFNMNPRGVNGGPPLLCFGSLLWQIEHHGDLGQYARICERVSGNPVPEPGDRPGEVFET